MTPTASVSVFSLTQYHGKNRVVLIFTPTESDARFERQINLFHQHKAELDERDIVVLPVIGSSETRARSQFRADAADFTVVLVGKDGAEKHRWKDAAPVSQINHRIDRMPMRRLEMARNLKTSAPAPGENQRFTTA